MSADQLQLTYAFFRRWRYVALATLLTLVLYYVLGYAFRPEAFSFAGVSFTDLLLLAVVDQFLIECFTTFILFRLIIGYARLFSLETVTLDARGLMRYEAAFLPLVLVAFFVTNPITQTARFLYREWGYYSWTTYADVYAYSVPLYLTYLGLFLPLVYLALNINLLLEYSTSTKNTLPQTPPDSPLPAKTATYVERIVGDLGGFQKPLLVRDVLWFEVEDRLYFAVTGQGRYRITLTLSALEDQLDPAQFIRINRATIVNVNAVDSFSPWINGKYVATLKDTKRTELTVSRSRAAAFKRALGQG